MDENRNHYYIVPDYEECFSRYEEIKSYIKHPDKLIEVIKEKPDLLFSDKVVKRVINIYRDVCKLGTPKEYDHAKSILKKARVDIFIPEEARVKRSEYKNYRWYKQNPWLLLWHVEYQKKLIKLYLKTTYKGKIDERNFHDKNKDILTAFENIMGFKPDAEYKKILTTKVEHSKDLTSISLSFLSLKTGYSEDVIPFESLKDLYYEISKQNKELKEYMAENVIDFIPFYIDGMIGYLEYRQILHGKLN